MKTLIKLTPILLIAGLVISGMDILVAAGIALFYAIFICKFVMGVSFNDVIEVVNEGAKEGVLCTIILLVAYPMTEAFLGTGVGAAVIRMFIGVGVTGRSVAMICFLAACLLSLATGTSWGTYAAILPMALWLTNLVGGSIPMTFAACVGGATFGDNFGLMSDTTILSSSIQGIKLTDRVRVQAPYAIACIVAASLVFFISGATMGLSATVGDASNVLSNIPEETIEVLMEERPSVLSLLEQVESGVPVYMILPVFLVIILAFLRIDVIVCLLCGFASSILLGITCGTVTSIGQVIDFLYYGFSGAGSWCVVTIILVCAFSGIMKKMAVFESISNIYVSRCKKVRELIFCNGLVCLFMNMALCEETAQVATVTPLIKDALEKNVEGSEEDIYKLKIRNAIFSDAVGVMTATLIPWHSGYAYYTSLADSLYPLHKFTYGDMLFNYFCWISIIVVFVFTITGLDRIIPNFGIPKEPAVRIKNRSVTEKL